MRDVFHSYARLGEAICRWPLLAAVGARAQELAATVLGEERVSIPCSFDRGLLLLSSGAAEPKSLGCRLYGVLADGRWLTEELSGRERSLFFREARALLMPGGRLCAVFSEPRYRSHGPVSGAGAPRGRPGERRRLRGELGEVFNTVLRLELAVRDAVEPELAARLVARKAAADRSPGDAPTGEVDLEDDVELQVALDLRDNFPQGEIAVSSAHGLGVLASSDIAFGTVLLELDGQVVPLDEIPYDRVQSVEWNAVENRALLVRYHPTKYGLINHSRTPNAEVETAARRVVASRDIRRGEEIFLDYRREPLPEEYFRRPPSYL